MKLISDNRGVILIYTLIMLMVFLSIAIAFSYFVISDINKAKAIDDSIVAYYGADSAVEQALYLLKKQDPAKTIDDLKLLSGTLSVSGAGWNLDESIDYEKNVLRQRLYSGESAKFFILNRQSEGNTQATTSNSISVEWYRDGNESAAKVQVALTQLNPQNASGTIVYYTDTSDLEIADASANNRGQTCYELKDSKIGGGTLNYESDYLLEAKVLGVNDTDYVDRLIIKSYSDVSCNDPYTEGISSQTIKSKGTFGRATQYVVAHVVPRDPVSGLLGFVLFSERDITKDTQ